MNKVTFAVVGAGKIGVRHIEEINENPNCKLIAICDKDIDVKSRIPVNIPFFDSVDELLQSGIDADYINICTPNGLHADQAIVALNAGYNVICEKPLALSVYDAKRIKEAQIKTKKEVICVMQNRFSPPSVLLKSVMDKGNLGDIYMVQINLLWNRDERYYKPKGWHGTQKLDGGVLFTQFSHFIDLVYWLFGDVTNIVSRFYDFNHSALTDFYDSGAVLFDIVKGGTGSITFSTSVAKENLESSIIVIGEKGSIKVSGQYMDTLEHFTVEGLEKPNIDKTMDANDYGAYKGSAANHAQIIQNAVDVANGKAEPATTLEEGIKTVEIIETINNSSQK